MNFVNQDIEAVTRAIGAMMNRQIVVDPRVKGAITVYSETPLTVNEAYLNYLSALRGLGFTVVENAGLLKVVPEADAKLQAGTVSIGNSGRRGDQILTQIFRLNHENPNNLVAVLRPLISPNNTINANPGNNSLVITDYADNLARIGKIIAALDQPAAGDIEILPLKFGVAADMAPLVQRLSDGGGAGAVPGVPAAAGGALSVIADSRSNSLIVRSSNARQAGPGAQHRRQARPAQPDRRPGRQHLGRAPEECRRDQDGAGAARRLHDHRRRRVAAAASRPRSRSSNRCSNSKAVQRAHRRRPRRRSRPRPGPRPAASSRPTRRPTR